jgi:hypothetical protein
MRRMATPKPGQIRCPTCHRSTAPAAYCTHCGTPIPEGARARPRGLDRAELEDRIRGRRGPAPFRRGDYIEGAAASGAGYERYAPEPEDRLARPEPDEPQEPRIDRLAEPPAPPTPVPMRGWDAGPDYEADERWSAPPESATGWEPAESAPGWEPPVTPPQWERPLRQPEERYATDEEAYPDEEVAPAYAEEAYPYAYPGGDVPAEEERRGGIGPLILVAFVVVGLIAVIGGAVLAGALGGPVAEASPTPTPRVTDTPPAETPLPTDTPPAESPQTSPGASPDGTFVFPDGFTAQAQPCAVEPEADGQGSGTCPQEGSQISSGDRVWILITFTNVAVGDVIAVQVTDPSGTQHDEGSWDATGRGRGWAYFSVVSSRSATGDYEVLVTRNGQPAAETSFQVQG